MFDTVLIIYEGGTDMNKTTIKELNTLLKGEFMAVDGYGKYIQKLKGEDSNIVQEFQDIQSDHRKHIEKISQRVQDLGGKPVKNTGMMGKMAEMYSSMKNMRKDKIEEVTKLAYEGENKGIKMAKEISKGDLDSGSATLINEILSQDQKHLNTLKGYIH